ncbi:ABC-2 type transporter [compost metagenome]
MSHLSAPTRSVSLSSRARLLLAFVRRDVAARYQGTLLGGFWVLLAPFLLLMVYTFVFGHVLKSRWGSDQDTASFALTLYSGLLLNGILADSLSRAATVIHGHGNYVKKLVFPLEILPLALVLSALVNAIIGFLILALLLPLLGHVPSWKILLVPLMLLPMLLCASGLAWFFAALGAYFRDISQFIQLLLVLILFISPVLYPLSALPENLRAYLALNPLTIPLEMIRHAFFGTPMPSTGQVMAYLGASSLASLLGLLWFQRMKDGFADVL